MKNTLFILSFLALSLGSATAQSADEAAIRTVIESESKAYHTNTDRMAFTSYWNINANTRMVYTGTDGTNLMTGDAMKAAIASGQMPPVDNAVNEFTNFVVKASGNTGWATFDQKSTDAKGVVSYMHEFRCMEKMGGSWKIASSSVHQYQPK